MKSSCHILFVVSELWKENRTTFSAFDHQNQIRFLLTPPTDQIQFKYAQYFKEINLNTKPASLSSIAFLALSAFLEFKGIDDS